MVGVNEVNAAMPFAVATIALISAELLDLPPTAGGRAAGAAQIEPQAPQRARITTVPAAEPDRTTDSYRLESPYGPAGSTDLALYLGRRDHGAQLEFGALGGGRSDAPGLIHVGIGWDF